MAWFFCFLVFVSSPFCSVFLNDECFCEDDEEREEDGADDDANQAEEFEPAEDADEGEAGVELGFSADEERTDDVVNL